MSAGASFSILGHSLEIAEDKKRANDIWKEFSQISSLWESRINDEFSTLFRNLDEVYEGLDGLAVSIADDAINKGLSFLTGAGVYEINEDVFFSEYMARYVTWDDDVSPVVNSFEAIVLETQELDAYRTARRENRRQWVGFGDRAVIEADARNLNSNIAHGVFNMLAKGVTALGNQVRKDEIYNDFSTREVISGSAVKLIDAAYLATVDAVRSAASMDVYAYSDSEKARVSAIIDNVYKSRVPDADVAPALVRCLEIYPYDDRVFTAIIERFGVNAPGLASICEFFGFKALGDHKRNQFEKWCASLAATSVSDIEAQVPQIKSYAESIDYKVDTGVLVSDVASILNVHNLEREKDQNDASCNGVKVSEGNAGSVGGSVDLAVATQGFKSIPDKKFYVAPDLPDKKINNFSSKAKSSIEIDKVIFYFDETVFGKGDDGVVVTDQHLHARIPLESEECIPLNQIESVRPGGLLGMKICLSLTDGRDVSIKLTQSKSGSKLLRQAIEQLIGLV